MYSDSDDEDLGGLPDLPPASRMMLARQNTEGHIQTNEPGQSLLPEDAELDEEASETVNVLMIGTGFSFFSFFFLFSSFFSVLFSHFIHDS